MNDLPDVQHQPPVSPAHSTGTITRRFSKGFQSCLKGARDDFDDLDVDQGKESGMAVIYLLMYAYIGILFGGALSTKPFFESFTPTKKTPDARKIFDTESYSFAIN